MRGGVARGRLAFALTALAFAYDLALLVAIVAAPTVDGQTLLEYGGFLSLALFAQPLLVTLLLWSLLRERCKRDSAAATAAAWTIASLYLAYSVLGGLSIAAGALPAALLLFVAVSVTPRPDTARP